MKIQDYFEEEYQKTVHDIKNHRQESDLLFALVTDSHLSDNGEHTRENIAAVDEQVHFDFLVHLGDLLTGNTPERISRRNLREELHAYRNALESKIMYVVQGNHDGYMNEAYQGQVVGDIALDENWYEDTSFLDTYPNVSRYGQKPYFFADIPEKNLRMIFLCSTGYFHDRKEKKFEKKYAFGEEQLQWLGGTALQIPSVGWSIMVFSHIQPFAEMNFEKQEKEIQWKADYKEAEELLQAFCRKGGHVLCWFFGHNHGDFSGEIDGIPYVGTASQTAYIPQLWEAIGTFPGPREMGTVGEDAWDAVLWKKTEKKLLFFRFGAGENRVIHLRGGDSRLQAVSKKTVSVAGVNPPLR